jgi:hypothetical protein
MNDPHSLLVFKVDKNSANEKFYTIELHGCPTCAIRAIKQALLNHPSIKLLIKEAVHQANLELAKDKPNTPNPNMN